MKERKKPSLPSPQTQDFILRDIVESSWGYDAVLVAYKIGLFSALAEKSKELKQLCADLKIAERPLKMLLDKDGKNSFTVASASLSMLLWTEGQQFRARN